MLRIFIYFGKIGFLSWRSFNILTRTVVVLSTKTRAESFSYFAQFFSNNLLALSLAVKISSETPIGKIHENIILWVADSQRQQSSFSEGIFHFRLARRRDQSTSLSFSCTTHVVLQLPLSRPRCNWTVHFFYLLLYIKLRSRNYKNSERIVIDLMLH